MSSNTINSKLYLNRPFSSESLSGYESDTEIDDIQRDQNRLSERIDGDWVIVDRKRHPTPPLTGHAKDRIKERAVSIEDIKEAMDHGHTARIRTNHGEGTKYWDKKTVVIVGDPRLGEKIVSVWPRGSNSEIENKAHTPAQRIQSAQRAIVRKIQHTLSVMSVNPHLDLKFWEETSVRHDVDLTIRNGRFSFIYGDKRISVPYFTHDDSGKTGEAYASFGDSSINGINSFSLVVPEIGRIWIPLPR